MTSLLKWAIAATVILTIPFASHAQAAPSFDCAKASTRVEFMICDHPRIARLDSQLADAYRVALRDSPWASANRRIRAEQKDWIAERNRCRNPRCLRQLYRQRITQLRAEVSGGGNSGTGNSSGGSSSEASDLVQVRGVPTNDILNVRSGPGTNYRIVGALANGDTVRNLGCQAQGSSRWCEIEMMSDMRERGWVNARFLTIGSASQLPSMPSGEADGGSRTERVRFAAGTTGAEYSDTLAPGESISYILGAAKGQILYVQVEHRNGPRTEFQIFRPDGSVLEPMRYTDRAFRDRLSASGDYIIEIVNRVGNRAEFDVIFEVN